MSRIRYQSKENGRAILKDNWPKAIAIFMILTTMVVGISVLENRYRQAFGIPQEDSQGLLAMNPPSLIISAVFSVLMVLFTQPLSMGQKEWYWRLSGNQEVYVGDVFGWFGSLRLYFKSLWLWLNIYVRYLLWAVAICAVPYAMVFGSVYGLLRHSTQPVLLAAGVLLMIFGLLLLIAAIFLLLYVVMRYMLASYLMVEDNTRKVGGVIRDSVRYSRSYRGEMFRFFLSFIPWAVLCILIVPLFYVVPYFNASLSVFARHLIFAQRANEKQDPGAPSQGPDRPVQL